MVESSVKYLTRIKHARADRVSPVTIRRFMYKTRLFRKKTPSMEGSTPYVWKTRFTPIG
jgi:hypothetical protein